MAIPTDGNDILVGTDGNDSIDGLDGNDLIQGLAGNDGLYGNDGNDTLEGGDGDDYLNPGDGVNAIAGGTGSDKLDLNYDYDTDGIIINYSDSTNGTISDGSTIKEVERIDLKTGSGNDNIDISATDNTRYSDPYYGNRWQDNDTKVYANNGNDTVIGGSGGDEIYGGAGNDILTGNAGNDKLVGGEGEDILNGGAGDDELYGEDGNDTLNGGDGNDYLNGGKGINSVIGGAGSDKLDLDYTTNTTGITINYSDPTNGTISDGLTTKEIKEVERIDLKTGSGNDNIDISATDNTRYSDPYYGNRWQDNDTKVYANNGNDTVIGGSGGDEIYGGAGNDILTGNEGNDKLVGGEGEDILNGGAGDDELYGEDGSDTLNGGDGNDYLNGGKGINSVIGGAGSDKLDLDYTTNTTGITINYSDPTNGTISDGLTTKEIKEVERIDLKTGSGNDNIDISATDNTRYSDPYYGNRWQDNDTKVYANNGNDTVIGGSGGDEIYGGAGNDILTGNEGNDKLVGGRGNDILNGGTGNDEIYGENDNDILDGGLGNDTLNGGSGTDTLKVDYSAITTVGISTTVTTPSSGTISAAGNVVNYSNIEKFNITGTTQADNLIGGNLDDILIGGDGNDTLTSGTGNDTIQGGNGNDTITGGTGADSLVGGRGDDIYIVDELGDIITEGSNQGLDTVRASITYSLASIANVENLTLTGTANINATGNAINNILTGNSGNNTLNGAAGHDRLIGVDETSTTPGKAEVDTLIGGAGRDRFVLGNGSKVFYDDGDTTNAGTADYAIIQGFSASEDFIELSGEKTDYTLNTTYSPGNTAIYRNKPTGEPAELIGLIQGVTGLNLTSSAFITYFGYFNDFETATGTEWSNQTRSITPVGERNFLGEFGNDTVSLTLNNQANTTVTLEFDLFILKTWDGSYGGGPDIFTLSIDGGQTLLNTTFSNVGNEQAYPGTFGSATYPGRTGAVENNTLGYTYYGDSVYRISSTFQAPSSNLIINFAGSGLQDIGDESWGLDNVKVTTFTTPTALSAGTLAFSRPTFQVNEDGTAVAAVTVTRSGGSNGEVRATITSQGQTATNWGDFDPTAIDVTFGHGDTTAKVITIPIYNDFKAESDETLLLGLTNAVGGATIGTQNTATLTIVDNNDAPVTYYLTNAGSWTNAQGQAEALGGNLVTINDPSENQFLVTAFGSEYFWIGLNDVAAEGNFAWVNGESSKYTNWYGVQPDNSNNEDYVFMNYGPGTWADISNNNLYRGIVEVVNGVSTLSVGNVSIDEEAVINGKITVTVTLTGVRPDKTFTVDYSTADVTATAGQDYTATNGTLTFNAGESVKTFTIDINNDTVYEGNETFRVTLSNPTGGAVLGQNVSTITLTETPPVLAFSQPTFIFKEDGTGTTQITVTRTGSPDNTVSATISLTNGQAVAPDDYNNSSITVSFAPGETSKVVNIPLVDDIRFEEEEDLTLTLSNPTNSAILGTQATAKLTIQDNDINQGVVLNQAIPVTIDNTKLKVSNVGALTGNFGLSFNGVDNYVEIPHSAALSLNTFTLEAWVNQTQIKGDWQPIITKEANNGYEVNYGLYIEPNGSRLDFAFQDSNGNWRYIYPSQASLTLNQLTHVAATYDGAKLSLYINGQLDTSVDWVGTPLQNNYPVKIGRELNAWNPFAGQIDDVRIWNVARTQTEIQANYNQQLVGNETGLAGYWNFNEPSGSTALDKTINGNNGNIIGATHVNQTGTPTEQLAAANIIYTVTDLPDQGVLGLTSGSDKALSFNGVDNYVDVGNPATLQITGNQTIEMWLKPTNFNNRQNPYAKAYGGEGTITVETDGTVSYFYGVSGDNSGDYQGFNTGVSLKADEWNHLSIVRDLTANKLYWYINGAKVNEIDAQYSAAVASSNAIYIGRGYVSNLSGQIDDVRIWNVARTQTQIQANLNKTLTGTETGLAGYWNFNNITGNTATDLTTNGNNGTIYGATVTGNPILSTVTPLKVGDTFTQADIDSGKLIYQPGSSSSIQDFFQFNFTDGTNPVTNQTFFLSHTDQTTNGTAENQTLNGTASKDKINGLGGDDILNGGADHDLLQGGTGNDTLNGEAGNDFLYGGVGNDILRGGTGDDSYLIDSTTETITENANEGTDTVYSTLTFSLADFPNLENLILTGIDAINGTGNAANNVITGNNGNNSLNGGAGTDTLIGGLGDDIYIVDSTTDIITEQANEGTDTIQSSVTLTIATNLENLTLTGTAAINGTGNAGNNLITGNDVNNSLNGAAGNDTLNGGAGTDTLIGGLGDDIYIVDTATDTITEQANAGTDTIQSGVTLTIATNLENLTLTGTAAINGTGNAGNNVITGNTGNNTLNGAAGNDTLNGGDGTDTLIGGTGNDVYIVDSTTDTITEQANAGTDTIQSGVTLTIATNLENLTLTGTAEINGTGNAGNNVITGNGGNNTLDGGAGTDRLIGGSGNDIYIVDSTTDTITENANEGTDTIQSSVTYTILAANVENLTLTGTAAINGTGNAGNNVITGNGGNNTLDGAAGNDTLNGGDGIDTLVGGTGDDVYIVDTATDVITENVGQGTDIVQSSSVSYTLADNVENLTLTGTANINGTGNGINNTITGNTGNNTLDGGAGTDTLIGGLGNDIYIVDSTTDTITELANEGTDTIQSSITYTIAAANVENLTLTGTAAINGTGNGGNNVITGNTGNNTLDGGAGTDTLIGGSGDDIYIVDSTTDTITELASGGTDTIQSSVTLTIATNVENLTLTGTAAINGTGNGDNNVITGNTGNNTLDGGAGTDTLIGGSGNDIYIVDSTTDTITELASGGTDTIQSSVTYTIAAANVENLTLRGTAAINGTGNAGNNVMTGNTGNNTLDGGAGNDRLTGGTGNDTLIGGLGTDRFDYRTLSGSVFGNFDVITDFNATADLFLVSTAPTRFSNAGSVSTLDTTGIAARLTNTVFTANSAAQFTFGTRSFVAINDATAGFNATTDAIIEVTGFTGTLVLNNFTTALV
jgi:Ca2+-binding RTX toxin-like protein